MKEVHWLYFVQKLATNIVLDRYCVRWFDYLRYPIFLFKILIFKLKEWSYDRTAPFLSFLFFYVYVESPNPKKPEGPTPQAPNPINWKPQPQKPNIRPQDQNPKPPKRAKIRKKYKK